MRREWDLRKIWPVVGMFVVLVVAYGFDRWTEAMRETVSRTFRGTWKLAWVLSLSRLVIAALLIGLCRVVSASEGRGVVVGVAFTALGLIFVFSPQLAFGLNLRLPLLLTFPGHRLVSWASAFVAALGLFTIIGGVRTGN